MAAILILMFMKVPWVFILNIWRVATIGWRNKAMLRGIQKIARANRLRMEKWRPKWMKEWQEDREKGEVLTVVERQRQSKRVDCRAYEIQPTNDWYYK